MADLELFFAGLFSLRLLLGSFFWAAAIRELFSELGAITNSLLSELRAGSMTGVADGIWRVLLLLCAMMVCSGGWMVDELNFSQGNIL
jgi:hypothetical protein